MRAAQMQLGMQTSGEGFESAGEPGTLYARPAPPCPSTFSSHLAFLFLICVLSSSQISLSIFPRQLQMACEDQNTSACGISSQTICVLLLPLGSLICILCENMPGTLKEFNPGTKLEGLENRHHHVHERSNWISSVTPFPFDLENDLIS